MRVLIVRTCDLIIRACPDQCVIAIAKIIKYIFDPNNATIKITKKNAGISKKVARFSFPMCTTINMNACAAFIFTTVIFVSQMNGVQFSFFELIGWIFIATIAAVGNAAVPMGCYFLSGSLLAANNVPLNILGIILPVYALIDMLETAINVWSDSCVSAVVDKDIIK